MTAHAKHPRILAAKIATAHGVKGLIKLNVYVEDMELLENATVYDAQQGGEQIKLSLKNPIGKQWIASIDGIADRNAAEALRHTELWIDKAALPKAKKGEYYVSDLIGLKALDENGHEIGAIIAVPDFGAGTLLEIKPAGKASFYLPFTSDTVPNDQPSDGALIVIIPPGLL